MKIAPVFHPTRSSYLVFTLDFFIPFAVILVILSLGWAALYSPIFHISHITCTLDYTECQGQDLLAELERVKGQNIFRFHRNAFATRLTSADFTIREAKVARILPSTLVLTLHSVYPVVALKLIGEVDWVVLDDQFRVIKTISQDPNVPTVVVPGPLTLVVGKPPSDPSIISTLSLARRLADELFTVKAVTLLDAQTISLTLDDNRQALLTLQKDELTQIRALQAVLADDTITKDVSVIDMRFARPVLR
ncbi:MAG: hypothetical protein UX62_C0055G0006 [Microgenomates group bacterium GW2011_GWA2_46_7]|nr:MAG: hypothetical protein UX62_C0055G0006 [Microgenomates group bacterium GW2011_GWA2_46_7]